MTRAQGSCGARPGDLRANWAVTMFRHENRLATDDRGNGVLEDELLLIVVFQQDGIFIERAYASRQFHAAYQINSDLGFIFADRIQKSVLNILCSLALHLPSPCRAN